MKSTVIHDLRDRADRCRCILSLIEAGDERRNVAQLVVCLVGPGGGDAPECDPADFDADFNVDLNDFAVFQANFDVP